MPRQNPKGFTLIEVLIAMAIFAIGFLAVAGMQTRALSSTVSSRTITEALELASATIEEFQGIPLYDESLDLNGDGTASFFDIHPYFDQDKADEHKSVKDNFTITWSVTPNKPIAAIPNVFTSSGPDPVTVSKTIHVTVFETRRPGKILAEIEMIKVWGRDG